VRQRGARRGREPLMEAAANKAMALTGKGYVPLGEKA
jgi:hypothetical protein